MTVMITSAGMLGVHVARTMLDQGVGVLLYAPEPSRTYVESVVGRDRKLFSIDRSDTRDLARMIELILKVGVTRILHIPPLFGDVHEEQPSLDFQNSVAASINPLEAARIRGLARITVVGPRAGFESIGQDDPDTLTYGASAFGVPNSFDSAYRSMMEMLAITYLRHSGVNLVFCRPSELFGRGQFGAAREHGKAITDILISALEAPPGSRIPITLPAAERVYVKDAALAIREAVFAERPTKRIFDIGSGQIVTAELLAAAMNRAIPGLEAFALNAAEPGSGQPPLVDDSSARAELGYAPHWSLDDAVADCISELRPMLHLYSESAARL